MTTTVKDPTAPYRVAMDKARKRKAGLKRVEVWVPEEFRKDLIKYAKRLREYHAEEM